MLHLYIMCPWKACHHHPVPDFPMPGPRSALIILDLFQFSSVTQSCPTLFNPGTAAHKASLSITSSQSLLKLMPIESVMPSNHLILSSPSPTFSLSQHQGLFQ